MKTTHLLLLSASLLFLFMGIVYTKSSHECRIPVEVVEKPIDSPKTEKPQVATKYKLYYSCSSKRVTTKSTTAAEAEALVKELKEFGFEAKLNVWELLPASGMLNQTLYWVEYELTGTKHVTYDTMEEAVGAKGKLADLGCAVEIKEVKE